jgi:hypothetical protein
MKLEQIEGKKCALQMSSKKRHLLTIPYRSTPTNTVLNYATR